MCGKLVNCVAAAAGATAAGHTLLATDTLQLNSFPRNTSGESSEPTVYRWVTRNIVFPALAPETAHRMALTSLKVLGAAWSGLGFDRYHAKLDHPSDDQLRTKVLGIEFRSPVGIAAGFDKNGETIAFMGSSLGEAFGAGHIEIGSVSFGPWPGNPKPRLFRAPEYKALINRLGFHTEGIDVVSSRIGPYMSRLAPHVSRLAPYMSKTSTSSAFLPTRIGVNVNRTANPHIPIERANKDFLTTIKRSLDLKPAWLTLDVSCPNTATGQKSEQDLEELKSLVSAAVAMASGTPILVKLSPLSSVNTPQETLKRVAICVESGASGFVLANTAGHREFDLPNEPPFTERGGLSGAPMYPKTLELVKAVRSYLKTSSKPDAVIVAVGGVSTAGQCRELLDSGANLIQILTGMIYEGPLLLRRINAALASRKPAGNM